MSLVFNMVGGGGGGGGIKLTEIAVTTAPAGASVASPTAVRWIFTGLPASTMDALGQGTSPRT